jgi:hypothetical protein
LPKTPSKTKKSKETKDPNLKTFKKPRENQKKQKKQNLSTLLPAKGLHAKSWLHPIVLVWGVFLTSLWLWFLEEPSTRWESNYGSNGRHGFATFKPLWVPKICLGTSKTIPVKTMGP